MRISRRVFLTGLAASVATEARSDLYDDYINSVSRAPFVSFYARDDSATGHAFVGLGTELDNGLLFYEGLFGFYPASSGKKAYMALLKDDGVIDFRWEDLGPHTQQFRLRVSNERKAAAEAVLKRWKADKPAYNLLAMGGNNCNVLAKEVAESIALKIPSQNPGTTFPANYFRHLQELNRT